MSLYDPSDDRLVKQGLISYKEAADMQKKGWLAGPQEEANRPEKGAGIKPDNRPGVR